MGENRRPGRPGSRPGQAGLAAKHPPVPGHRATALSARPFGTRRAQQLIAGAAPLLNHDFQQGGRPGSQRERTRRSGPARLRPVPPLTRKFRLSRKENRLCTCGTSVMRRVSALTGAGQASRRLACYGGAERGGRDGRRGRCHSGGAARGSSASVLRTSREVSCSAMAFRRARIGWRATGSARPSMRRLVGVPERCPLEQGAIARRRRPSPIAAAAIL